MTNKELDQKVCKAFEEATPDVLGSVLADCKKQEKTVIKFKSNTATWNKKFTFSAVAAILVIILSIGLTSKHFGVGPTHPTDPFQTGTQPPTDYQPGAVDWVMRASLVQPDGTIAETYPMTIKGTIEEGDPHCYVKLDIELPKSFRYIFMIPEPNGYQEIQYPMETPGDLISAGYTYDREENAPAFATWSINTEKEYFIAYWNDDFGCFLVGAADPNVKPTEIMEYFKPFIDVFGPSDPEPTDPELEGFPENMLTDPDILTHMQEMFSPGEEDVNYFYQALLSYYNSPYDVDWGTLFEHGMTEQEPLTDAEKKALRDKGLNLEHEIRRLTIDMIEDVLYDVFGHQYSYVIPEFKKHFTYLGSTDCYYAGCGDIDQADIRVVGMKTFSNDCARVYYIYDGEVKGVATLFSIYESWNGQRWIVYSNHLLGTEPAMQEFDIPDVYPSDLDKDSWNIARYQAMLDWKDGWYNQALNQGYLNYEEVLLREFFHNGFADEYAVTEDERAALKLDGEEAQMDGVRLPAAKMDQVLQRIYGAPLAYFPQSAFAGLYYLESTDCYYYFRNDTAEIPSIQVIGFRIERNHTELYYIDHSNQKLGVAIVVPSVNSCLIRSNQYYSDGAWPEMKYKSPKQEYHVEVPNDLRTDAAMLEKLQKLFGEDDWKNSWNLALCSIYENPLYVSLEDLFYNGTDETATEEEKYKLREKFESFDIDTDISRITKEKLNEVLEALYGITLEELHPKAFRNIRYLESTGCYYVSHSDAMCAGNLQVLGYRTLQNGNIEMYYTAEIEYPYCYGVVTLKPNVNGYLILSNIYEVAS